MVDVKCISSNGCDHIEVIRCLNGSVGSNLGARNVRGVGYQNWDFDRLELDGGVS